jgi:hypothetical protein
MTAINNQSQRTQLANRLADAQVISRGAAADLSEGKVSVQDMEAAKLLAARLKGSPLTEVASALAKAVGAAGASQSTLETLGASALNIGSAFQGEVIRNIR